MLTLWFTWYRVLKNTILNWNIHSLCYLEPGNHKGATTENCCSLLEGFVPTSNTLKTKTKTSIASSIIKFYKKILWRPLLPFILSTSTFTFQTLFLIMIRLKDKYWRNSWREYIFLFQTLVQIRKILRRMYLEKKK